MAETTTTGRAGSLVAILRIAARVCNLPCSLSSVLLLGYAAHPARYPPYCCSGMQPTLLAILRIAARVCSPPCSLSSVLLLGYATLFVAVHLKGAYSAAEAT